MTSSPERRLAVRYSAGMHLTLLLLIIFGLPSLFELTRDEEPQAITVEILPIAELSNVPNNPNPAPPKEEEKKEKPQEKPVPKVKEDAAKPEPVPDPKKIEKEKKKEEKKPEKKPEKKQENELEDILKSVEKEANRQTEPAKDKETATSSTPSQSDRYDPTMQMSISEKDMIRSQIEKNWSPPIGARDAHDLKVMLNIDVQLDGSVVDVKVDDMSRYHSDAFFRAAADSAVRAVWKSSPLKNLDPAKFQAWKEMELVFDPKDALY